MKMKNYTLFVLVSLFFAAAEARNEKAVSNFAPGTVAHEVASLIENDQDVAKRFELEDPHIINLLTQVDVAQFFYQRHTGIACLVSNLFFGNFLSLTQPKGLILLSEQKAPCLHAMIDELVQEAGIPKPAVFLSGDTELFNAFASSLSHSQAIVVVGKALVDGCSDQELKAILGHELSHVNYNHVPKSLAYKTLLVGACIGAFFGVEKVYTHYVVPRFGHSPTFKSIDEKIQANKDFIQKISFISLGAFVTYCMLALTRHYEREADHGAIMLTKDPQGFINAMERVKLYYEGKRDSFLTEYEYLQQKIDELGQACPEAQGHLANVSQQVKDMVLSNYHDALEVGSHTHPAMKDRIAFGHQMLENIKREAENPESFQG
ncbi:MAG: M48 family metalloprotease [Epsilonproteobacteria bacterium]|nr:M48 family metalloprotease [Campylobacterota bacterium]